VRRAVLALLSAALLAGCGGGLYDFPTDPDTSAACRALLDAVPEDVADQESTPVDSERVAAWGDPRIVLRCGVQRPKALEPTSRCDDVDGVGWFTEDRDGGGRLFTTIGRDPDVSVEVPGDYRPAGTALIDLAQAITAGTTVVEPCA
jgi:hypothetical protein